MGLLSYMLEENLKKVVPTKEVAVTPNYRHEKANTSLYYDIGTSDKVYNVVINQTDSVLDRYDVVVEWGRRGRKLQSMKKAISVSWPRANNIYHSLIEEKTNKGYKVKP